MNDAGALKELEDALPAEPPKSRFKPYPAYKDSGIEWLGKVPAHWCVKRLRFVAQINPSKSETRNIPPHTAVCFLPMEMIGEGFLHHTEELRCIGDVRSGYTYFRNGDVIVAKITPCFENGKGAEISDMPSGLGFGTTEIFVIRPDHSFITSRFLSFLSQSKLFRDTGTALMEGAAGQKRITADFVRDFPVPLPSLAEQSPLISFLDRETGKIDALIAKKQRLIELLKEKRTALITHAVTKGLNPSAPMKHSGIAWIGDVPEHWDVWRTKHISRLESGHTPSRQHPEYWENCTIPWFTLADVWQLRDDKAEYVSETAEKVSEIGLANSSARLLPAETVIVSRTASVGFSAIMSQPMATTQDFVNWVCSERILPAFLLYVFRAMRPEFQRLIMGSTHQTIYMPQVRTFVTPVPPISEQHRIIAHIRSGTAAIDELIEKIELHNEKLHEYRSALITAAVTGKIDVRDHAFHTESTT